MTGGFFYGCDGQALSQSMGACQRVPLFSSLKGQKMEAVVLGNVTLDILCYYVEDVPRHDSVPFGKVVIGPGGCGSNVAMGLSALGVSTALVAKIASGEVFSLVEPHWRRAGLDTRYVAVEKNADPAVSVGLVDRCAQPRFIHTPGANAGLTVDDLDPAALAQQGARFLHIGGFFGLPGLMDGRVPGILDAVRGLGIKTSLDVINSPHLETPGLLWSCLPHLDYFFCNLREGQRLTRLDEPARIGAEILDRGAGAAVVKLGEKGCRLESRAFSTTVPTEPRNAVDTTGAGDAFAAGFIAAILEGSDSREACLAGHRASARIVSTFGAVAGWYEPS
jgi:sugar/nucleoside kinase (ribokinase family)